MSTTRTTPFQDKHLLEFALKVNQVDAVTSQVVSVRCQLCVYYDREEDIR